MLEEAATSAPEITAAWIGLAGVAVGSLITGCLSWLTGRSAKRIEQLEAEVKRKTERIERLEREIHARIDYEDAAIEWVAEHEGKTGPAIKPKLRDRTEGIRGLRPSMSRSDLALRIDRPSVPIIPRDAPPPE